MLNKQSVAFLEHAIVKDGPTLVYSKLWTHYKVATIIHLSNLCTNAAWTAPAYWRASIKNIAPLSKKNNCKYCRSKILLYQKSTNYALLLLSNAWKVAATLKAKSSITLLNLTKICFCNGPCDSDIQNSPCLQDWVSYFPIRHEAHLWS